MLWFNFTTWLCIGCCCGVGNCALLFLVGDRNGEAPFDGIYRVLFDELPIKIRLTIRNIAGPRPEEFWDAIVHYVFYTNNILAQVFYLSLILGGYMCFVFFGYPLLPNCNLADYHKWTSLALVIACLISFVIASVSDPGVITASNVKILENVYSYDDILYIKGRECYSCKFPKIPRSKHCRLCDHCVWKFDHHCIWVANCIGYKNLQYFLLFLLLHSIFVVYGSAGLFLLLSGIVYEENLWNGKRHNTLVSDTLLLPKKKTAHFIDYSTHEVLPATLTRILQYLLHKYMIICYLWICCIVFAIILVAFTIFHIIEAHENTTTNECCRRRRIKADIKDAGGDANRVQNAYKEHKSIYRLLELLCPEMWLSLIQSHPTTPQQQEITTETKIKQS